MMNELADNTDEADEVETYEDLLPSTLPDGIHAEMATARDKHTAWEDQTALVVWSDRATERCGCCHDLIAREVERPVRLDFSDPVDGFIDRPEQCGCGEMLTVNWTVVHEPTGSEVSDAVQTVHERFLEEQEGQREIQRKELRHTLRQALHDPASEWPVSDRVDLGLPSGNEVPTALYRGAQSGLRRAVTVDLTDPDLHEEIEVTERDL